MCTGISLTSLDGGFIVARTDEWAVGNANHNHLAVFPRGKSYSAQTPEGRNGKSWTGKHGFLSVTAYGQPHGPDAMNEKGLYVGVYFFPGSCGYAPYEESQADRSMSAGDFMQWMLSSFETVAQVRENLDQVSVVSVVDPEFGAAPLPFHWKIADPSGDSIVIEIINGGEVKIYEPFLGVITNAPTYDWHLTNLRNYINIFPGSASPVTVGNMTFSPFGGGSGLVGVPGDFSPPSRFVRAALFTATARPLATSDDAVFEAFRILDNFNIPIGVTAMPDKLPDDLEGATQITIAADLPNRKYYFHTMNDREIRMIDLAKIDFATVRQHIFDGDAGARHLVREIVVSDGR